MRRTLAGFAAGALALAVLAAAGCGEPRSGAVSETGPCAQVVPLAQAHVRAGSRLVSVRALKRGQLRALLRTLDRDEPHGAVPGRERRLPRKGCVLVYSGSFKPRGAIGGAPSGRYLVLVIGVRHPRLLRGLVVERLPAVVSKSA